MNLLEPNSTFGVPSTMRVFKYVDRDNVAFFAERLPEDKSVGLLGHIGQVDRERFPALPPHPLLGWHPRSLPRVLSALEGH